MKQPKKNYSTPSAELLVVRFEQNIMSAEVKQAPLFDADVDGDWD